MLEGNAAEAERDVEMRRTERVFADLQGALIDRERLVVLPDAVMYVRDGCMRQRNVRMVGAKQLFADGQGTFGRRQGVGISANHRINAGQVVQALGSRRVD